MNSINDVRKIIQDLYDEFLKEEKRLNEICSNNSVKIDELDQKIHNCRKNEDIDFKVFSPRAGSGVDSKKIAELENEKETLEFESRNNTKQLRYYSDKVKKLEEALSLLDGNDYFPSVTDNTEFIDSIPDVVEEDVPVDPFDELFPSRKVVTSTDEKSVDEQTESDASVAVDILNNESNEDIDDNDSVSLKVESNEKFIDLDSLNSIVHKTEFAERIISNDTIRAKLEIKEIIKLLKELIHRYS